MIRKLLSVAAVFAAISVCANEAPASVTNSSSAAAIELSKMGQTLKSGFGLKYTANLDVTVPAMPGQSSTAPDTIKHYVTCVTVDKTGKGVETLSPIGGGQLQLYVDGKNVTVFDPSLKEYSSYPAVGGFVTSSQGIFLCSKAVYPSSSDVELSTQVSLVFPDDFSLGLFAPRTVPPGSIVQVSDEKSEVSGKAVDVVTQEYVTPQGGFTITYDIDATSYLPVSLHEESTNSQGKKSVSFNETFTKLTVMHSAPSAVDFTFSPPSGATRVTSNGQPSPPISRLFAPGTKTPAFSGPVKSAIIQAPLGH